MPDTRYTNGYSQSGFGVANEFHDGESFLFSSESVGEGHPGKHFQSVYEKPGINFSLLYPQFSS